MRTRQITIRLSVKHIQIGEGCLYNDKLVKSWLLLLVLVHPKKLIVCFQRVEELLRIVQEEVVVVGLLLVLEFYTHTSSRVVVVGGGVVRGDKEILAVEHRQQYLLFAKRKGRETGGERWGQTKVEAFGKL